MKIGQVAAAAGVNIDTLRYYERRGLLAEPSRQPSGYRDYPPDTVRVVRFVKRAQELGFSLDEVKPLLELRNARTQQRGALRSFAESKVREIDERIARLSSIRAALAGLLESCACGGTPACPILEALEDPMDGEGDARRNDPSLAPTGSCCSATGREKRQRNDHEDA